MQGRAWLLGCIAGLAACTSGATEGTPASDRGTVSGATTRSQVGAGLAARSNVAPGGAATAIANSAPSPAGFGAAATKSASAEPAPASADVAPPEVRAVCRISGEPADATARLGDEVAFHTRYGPRRRVSVRAPEGWHAGAGAGIEASDARHLARVVISDTVGPEVAFDATARSWIAMGVGLWGEMQFERPDRPDAAAPNVVRVVGVGPGKTGAYSLWQVWHVGPDAGPGSDGVHYGVVTVASMPSDAAPNLRAELFALLCSLRVVDDPGPGAPPTPSKVSP